ncbi:helix-turn-helix transcriptional regulator [Kaustia mangrovi]|uniref:Helix-turn-helix transcriptional regulator n=1 Tax=Kaustia mangrovi TaxID=2593653 RepID=A0A7S8C1Z4_9HYPH|nr:AraC family transcriptional regulator [Kaustia mangrovi]QPC41882.1 helix-turn-helix transcriptional regulator [Kaustia mangrovi]
MTAADLEGNTVFDCLSREGVPLRASAAFGDGIAAALWERDERAFTSYRAPNHNTLSLYVEGGNGIRRLNGRRVLRSNGSGSVCLMPDTLTTDWDVSGPVSMFHLYFPRSALDRVIAEVLEADPAAVALRDETYFQDPYLEGVIRAAVIPLHWDEPGDRLAVSQAAQMMLTYLATRFAERPARARIARGGLAPAVRRRVEEFVEAHLDRPLAIRDLASIAGLSPYHFARMFKQSTGESPHHYVLRRRVERAKTLIATGGLSLSEIALCCGFSSQSHFTARFRQIAGVTPRQFARATDSGLAA